MSKNVTEQTLIDLIGSEKRLIPVVEKAWESAAVHPRALYHFMHGFVEFNFYAAPSATRLAANLKLQHMDEAAASVFAALPDEYGTFPTSPDHRTLALGLLSAIGDYAGISLAEKKVPVPEWHKHITDQLQHLYQGQVNDRPALIRALGAHWASEHLADREYAAGDRIIRHEFKGEGFDQYLDETFLQKNTDGETVYKMYFRRWELDPWSWIRFHGTAHHHATEFEHFIHAQNAVKSVLDQPLQNTLEQIWKWISEGALEFAELQNRFFTRITEECETFSHRTITTTVKIAS